jgi:hypothetical protein
MIFLSIAARRPTLRRSSPWIAGLTGCDGIARRSMVSKSARASQFNEIRAGVLPAELVPHRRLRYYYILFNQLSDKHH